METIIRVVTISLTLLIILSITNPTKGQIPEKRIYLWDVTISMVQNNIWDTVKVNLINAIRNITDEETVIIVMPYQDNILETWQASASNEGKKDLIRKINKYPKTQSGIGGYTNIAGAINSGVQQFENGFLNYLFILTDDGNHEDHIIRHFPSLQSAFNSFCSTATGINGYGFCIVHSNTGLTYYNFKELADSTCRMYMVDGLDIDIAILRPPVVVNHLIRDARNCDLRFEYNRIPSNFYFSLELDNNPYYRLSNPHIKYTISSNGITEIHLDTLQPLSSVPPIVSLILNIVIDNSVFPLVRSAPVSCSLIVHNQRFKVFEIANIKSKLVDFGKSKYYNPFLWVKPDSATLSTTLFYHFNADALAENAFVKLLLADDNGNRITDNKIIIYYNDIKSLDGAILLNATQSDSIRVSIKFLLGANHQIYRGSFLLIDHDIDLANQIDVRNNNTIEILSWKARYYKIWNPLARLLTIFSFLALVFIIFRITVIKRMLYPVFKGLRRNFESPNQLRLINFTGKRKIIIQNIVEKQSFFDKLWRGPVLYVVDDTCDTPIVFTPHKRKRKLIRYRLDREHYNVNPADAYLEQGRIYIFTNNVNKRHFKIQ